MVMRKTQVNKLFEWKEFVDTMVIKSSDLNDKFLF